MARTVRKKIVPAGRAMEYAGADAALYLTKPAYSFGDVELIRFQSRAALESFNKKANLAALIRTPVAKGCALYRHQTENV